MKKSSFLLGALGLVALGFSACTSDMPEVTNNGFAQNDELRYLRVAIVNPAVGSRAGDGDFVNGTEAENAVNNMQFRFYDASGNPIHGEAILLDTDGNTLGENDVPTFTDGTTDGNVGKICEGLVQLSLERGAAYPSYVVCFINPVNYAELGDNLTMQQLHTAIREGYQASETSGFAMNNSVYYGNDPVSGANNVRMFGTPILTNNLKTSQADAINAAPADVVNIYVERYAAKVTFNLAQNAINPVTVGDYKLTFVPEAWSINAEAPTMYAAKRFDATASETEVIPTLAQVNAMLGTWNLWNDAPNHRCYWACSPSYYASEFPQVSDDIIAAAETGTGAGQVVGDYALKYYSYNQVTGVDAGSTGLGVTTFNTAAKYTLENTMGSAAFNSANPMAAAPSVILVGHYDLTVGDGTTVLPVTNGFCIYNGRVFFRGSVPTGASANAKTMFNEFVDQNEILAVNGTGTLLKTGNMANYQASLEVAHPSAAVRGTQPIPHRYVTLQLKSVPATPLYYKPAGSNQWVAVTADNLDFVNTLLWQQLGNASSYTSNKCYFSIPIQHLGYTENTAGKPVDAEGNIDWKKVRVGDFGLVRNHVYNINVTKISGRANGIENLDNPLVPSMPTTDYWIKYTVNILNWRLNPTQDVEL